MRTYQRTHPWIKFEVDLRPAPPKLWMLLGEAASKCEHIAGVPLRPATAESLHRLYLAKGALATTAIEGNTLSEEEVLQHLEGKLHLPPSREYLGKEVENVVEACNRIKNMLLMGDVPALTPGLIKTFNKLVIEGLDLEDGVIPGEIRRHRVGVARYRAAPPEDCEYLVERLCQWLEGPAFEAPEPTMRTAYAIIKAVLAHLYLAWIHPFGDGNGRTARLVEFYVLVVSGVPTPAAHLLSNHYNQTRSEYYRQLDRASKLRGDVAPFLVYGVQGLVDGLREQLNVIRLQQWDVAWENYVHDSFREKRGEGAARQKQLVLALSERSDPVPRSQLRQLSGRVAEAYTGRTDRCLSRDLNALVEMGLIRKEGRGYAAQREAILAFLPSKVAPNRPGST